jgi:hypothetical protein
MPQLSFDPEQQPRSVLVELTWDEVRNDWDVRSVMTSQKLAVMQRYSKRLSDGYNATQLCFAIAQCFEDWIDLTPGFAMAAFAKSLSRLEPDETPSGLRPHHVADHGDGRSAPWRAQGYRRGPRRH